MNFQQILAIPFYFDIINTVFMESQLSQYGTSQRAQVLHIYKIVANDFDGVKTFYISESQHETFTKIDEEGFTARFKSRNSQLYKLETMLRTAVLFELTGKNPLGIYMTYKLYPKPDCINHKDDIFQHANVDREFYNTLCLMNMQL
tara:strand:+ start:1604 stop:2041 length:438 start_codon:yes stop_codon:yes gene_type:complete